MKIFFLILFSGVLSFAQGSAIADASLWMQNTLSGKSCEELNQEDFNNVRTFLDQQECLAARPSIPTVGVSLNDAAEFEVFQDMAKDQLAQTECEISNVGRFEKDQDLMKMRAEETSAKLPFIKQQMDEAAKLYAEYSRKSDQGNGVAAGCRNAEGSARTSCFQELEKLREQEKVLKEKWEFHQGQALAHITSTWSGGTETMSEAVIKMAKKNPLPTDAQIQQEMSKLIPEVKTELNKNRQTLLDQSTVRKGERVFDKLSDSTKRKLLEDSLEGGLFMKAIEKKDVSMVKLLCRLEGKYTKGRDKLTTTVSVGTLFLGGGAGMLSKVPIALRAGRVAQMAAKVKNASKVLSYAALGMDAGLVVESVARACFSKQINLTSKNSCPKNAEEFRKSEIKKIETDNCVLEAAMNVAPAGVLVSSVVFNAVKKNLDHYKNLSATLEETDKIKLVRQEAENQAERMQTIVNKRPEVRAEQFAERQQAAEKTFKDYNLSVSEVKKERLIDQEKIKKRESAKSRLEYDYKAKKAASDSFFQELTEAKKRLQESMDQLTKNLGIGKGHAANVDEMIMSKKQELEILTKTGRTSPEELTLKRKELSDLEARQKRIKDQIETVEDDIAASEAQMQQYNQDEEFGRQELARMEAEQKAKIAQFDDEIRLEKENPSLTRSEYDSSVDMGLALGGVTAKEKAVLDASRDSRKLYKFDRVPEPDVNATAKSPFWAHPEFGSRFRELKRMGVDVVMDPQAVSSATYYSFVNGKKAVYIGPKMPYHLFEHEFTHAKFDDLVADAVAKNDVIKKTFKEGAQLSFILPESTLAQYSKKDLSSLQKLLEKYDDRVTVDESFAVRKQLEAYGWRPMDPHYYFNKIYGDSYRVQELMATQSKLQAQGKNLTAAQAKELDMQIQKIALHSSLERGTREVQNQIAVIKRDLQNGRTAQALASWQIVQQRLKAEDPTRPKFFYNDKGEFIRMESASGKIQYTNLGPQP